MCVCIYIYIYIYIYTHIYTKDLGSYQHTQSKDSVISILKMFSLIVTIFSVHNMYLPMFQALIESEVSIYVCVCCVCI